ncbi:Uncharacterised protein [Vibrio cholerae]|nr:Uncharacterised protein [Vibrio cholerae]
MAVVPTVEFKLIGRATHDRNNRHTRTNCRMESARFKRQ